jgi:hypothetical protein
MSAKRPPEVGVHRLRTSILQAAANSARPLHGSDVVEQFAKSGWTLTPSVKDVRHAVRWLEGHGLVEWRKSDHGPGKELHLTGAGKEAARQGLGRSPSGRSDDEPSRLRSYPTPHVRRGGLAGGATAGRCVPSLVRYAATHVRCLPC